MHQLAIVERCDCAQGRDERLERFIQIKILAGAPTPGVYPANDKTKAEYKDWLAAGEPREWCR